MHKKYLNSKFLPIVSNWHETTQNPTNISTSTILALKAIVTSYTQHSIEGLCFVRMYVCMKDND